MTKLTLLLAPLLTLAVPHYMILQEAHPPQKARPPRSPVLLLPHYVIQIKTGFGGNYHGTIRKQGGLSIEFEVDPDATRAVDAIEPNEIVWRLSQTLHERSFDCVYTKSEELVVTSPNRLVANFRAKVHNQQNLAEMLLIVLTLDPSEGYPVDPEAIEIIPLKPM